ncbi:MAG: FecR domain-containing protein [Nitrospirae bacterium]|nr:FecR domain-containing protein [Nitrospirota bacterium]
MKKWITISFILMIFLIPAYSHSEDLSSLRISLAEGDVQIKTGDTAEWVAASINMPLMEGDELWVPEGGRVELQLNDGTYLRLDKDSSLGILSIGKNSFQFYLSAGRSYVDFRGLRNSVLQMDTPVSSIRIYDRSDVGIDVYNDGSTEVSVFLGAVNAESRSGKTRVGAGKSLSIKEDAYAELAPLGPVDEWERWNKGRDTKLYEQRYSSRYLPDELKVYSYDFDANGKWVYDNDYGYCWVPTVVVSSGWAPYRIGRWVWVGGDYVWVSYEPWGWVPYHYGRWSFIASVGWGWVPPVKGAVYWGPGFVGWVHTPTYVSWVPLAPGEIYYGYGHYGPHSVNITHIDIHKTVIKNVYKNVYVNNGVTTIHQDTFIKGKHVDLKIKENPFLKEKINVGRPQIKPEKTSLMPIVKEIPHIKQPPQSIKDVRVKELKEKRPLVKEKQASVLTPESPQKKMAVRSFKEPKGIASTQERTVTTERPSVPERSQKIKEPSVKEKTVRAERPSLTERPGISEKSQKVKEPSVKERTVRAERPTVPERSQKVKEPSVKERAVRTERPVVTEKGQGLREPSAKGKWVPTEKPAAKEKAQEIKEPLAKERWVKERWVPAEKPAAAEKQREVKETRIQEKQAPVEEKRAPKERQDVTERQKGFK